MTPDAMSKHLKNLKVADEYELSRTPALFPFISTSDYGQVGHILKSSDFTAQYQARVARVVDGKGYVSQIIYLNCSLMQVLRFFTDGANPQRESQIIGALTKSDSESEILQFFYQKTRRVIQNESFSMSGAPNSKAVDIVRDVLKAIPIHWAADLVNRLLKLVNLPTDPNVGQYLVNHQVI